MIEMILTLLKDAPKGKTDTIDFAKGKKKLPENFTELKQYLKTQLNGNN